MESSEHCVAFLTASGAADCPHGPGTLLEHLIGVSLVLRRWGCRHSLQLAGLFHSVYGTENFRPRLVERENREDVQDLIGREAEELAWLFSRLDRADFFGKRRHYRPECEEIRRQADLAMLVAANVVEQRWLWTRRRREKKREYLRRVAQFCQPSAVEALFDGVGDVV